MNKKLVRSYVLLLLLLCTMSCANNGTNALVNGNEPFVIYNGNGVIPRGDNVFTSWSLITNEKGKMHYYAASPGYKPVRFKLHTKFNKKVLWNIFFPPAFCWVHYTKVNSKKPNNVFFTKKAEHTALEYYNLAQSSKKWKKKMTYLRSAIMQDPLNKKGIALKAAHQMLDICYRHDKSEFNNVYNTVLHFSPNDHLARKYYVMNAWNIDLTEKKELSAIEYMAKAASAKSWRKQRDYLFDAIVQDADNTQGIALTAAHMLLEIGYNHSSKTTYKAYSLAKLYQPNDEYADYYYELRKAKVDARIEMWGNIASASAAALNSAATLFPNNSSSLNNITYNNNSSNSTNRNKTSKVGKQTNGTNTKTNNSKVKPAVDPAVYDNYVSELIKMKTGAHPYGDGFKDSDRIETQRLMRDVRIKYNKNTSSRKINKSEWEDWDGK